MKHLWWQQGDAQLKKIVSLLTFNISTAKKCIYGTFTFLWMHFDVKPLDLLGCIPPGRKLIKQSNIVLSNQRSSP